MRIQRRKEKLIKGVKILEVLGIVRLRDFETIPKLLSCGVDVNTVFGRKHLVGEGQIRQEEDDWLIISSLTKLQLSQMVETVEWSYFYNLKSNNLMMSSKDKTGFRRV